ncbi:NUDIX domain-containing protein [Krasilnikovia sp. MM14-A1004]|uniref:NUDIX domain-containing protein n=1 Tax=Krasilnikovia sp. MM14-A1004 TaxID=3373541 RepID=UPI00399C81D6
MEPAVGKLEEGEDVINAVIREVWEEVGVRVPTDDVRLAATVHSRAAGGTPFSANCVRAFLAGKPLLVAGWSDFGRDRVTPGPSLHLPRAHGASSRMLATVSIISAGQASLAPQPPLWAVPARSLPRRASRGHAGGAG